MSPTTFWTGSLVLGGLFIYDIVMVFYTYVSSKVSKDPLMVNITARPLMITVATQLDVPIKLVFPGPKRGGMLGLGDIVLPGIIMALALRFDLYLYYMRKQSPGATSKPSYITATGQWGERFWTRSISITSLPPSLAGTTFPKIYFYASLIGYVLGMLTTLAVLTIFNHAQPALLYLVPGVLGSLWGTALVRGELQLMWDYTEAGEVEEAKKEKGERDLNTTEEKEAEIPGVQKESSGEKESDMANKASAGKEKSKKETANGHAHHLFLFSLSSPRKTAYDNLSDI
jgi:minor histocompatibility antigen H13